MATTKKPVRSDDLAQRLRSDILAGRFEAGQRLTEQVLAERFRVGRARVREAIRELTFQGLLTTKPNCGATVAPEAPKAIRELIVPIRRTVEAYALRLVFDELGDADFAAWEAVLADMKAACRRKDLHAIAEADIAFHRKLIERAGQPDLLAIWEALVGRIRTHFRRTQRAIHRPMDIHDEHRDLLAAFRTGTEAAAVKLLKEKIG